MMLTGTWADWLWLIPLGIPLYCIIRVNIEAWTNYFKDKRKLKKDGGVK